MSARYIVRNSISEIVRKGFPHDPLPTMENHTFPFQGIFHVIHISHPPLWTIRIEDTDTRHALKLSKTGAASNLEMRSIFITEKQPAK